MSDVEDFEGYRKQAMGFLFWIIDNAGETGVSDLHIIPDLGVWRLVNGELKKDPELVVPDHYILEWMRRRGQLGDMDDTILDPAGHISLAYDTGRFRVRAAFRRSTLGVSVTLRLIPFSIPTPETINLPHQVVQMAQKSSGLILFEGPTGSGKTTAIASLIDYINRTMNKHIYLIEDPIEFTHKPFGDSVVTQREVGEHAMDFPSGVENALRSKPNVVVIGELLNPDTAKAALHAATTGHLVMTTAHAGSVTEAIDSFIGQFVAAEQPQIRSRLSQSLLGIMVQKLIPSTSGKLVPAREVLVHNRNFQELIRDDKMNMIRPQLETSPGCFSMEDSLIQLIREGFIHPDQAMEHARDVEAMEQGLQRLRADGVVLPA